MAPETRPASSTTTRPSRVYRPDHEATEAAAPALRPARLADRLLIAVFAVAIWLPLAGMVLGLDASYVLNENRVLAAAPAWSWDRAALAEYPRKFDTYFNDQFGFRKRMIHALSLAKVKGLGISPSPNSVAIGRQGWLFYTDCGADDYYRGTDRFNRDQLAAWGKMFQDRHDWLAERGSRYVVAIAPNKDTIYPELMPASINRVETRTRLDQLLAYLRNHTTVPVVDMREALIAHKPKARLYFRTDTHWNNRGGYVGYRAIMEPLSAWFPGLTPLPLSAFEPYRFPSRGGDLAGMLGLSDELTEYGYDLNPRVPRVARKAPVECLMQAGVPEYQLPFATELDDPNLPRAVMFRDSFAGSLSLYLSEHFRRISYAWKYTFDRDLIEREKPDVVIQELVERALMWNIPEYQEGIVATPNRIWSHDDPTAR